MNRMSSSPTSPTRRKHMHPPTTLPGFRPSPRPKQRPIGEMTVRELQDRHTLNSKLLRSPQASTSSYVQRVTAEQAEVESRLIEVDGMETINTGLRKTAIRGEGDMSIDVPPEPPTSRTLEAKRKALSQFGRNKPSSSMTESISMQEAMDLERQAFLQDRERQQRLEDKKRRMGLPVGGEILTKQEREAKIWAFMNHKPSESDIEDDDDDEDDDGPSSWFEDDQDDGRKGQDIIEPDVEDFSDIIRVDESRIHYSTFYEPRGEGD